MTTSSYGASTQSSGRVVVKSDISIDDITNFDVLIVDDITDTARTMDFVVKHIKSKNPKSLKTCVLLDKPSRDRKSTRLNSSHANNLVCRLLLEKKKKDIKPIYPNTS